MSVPRPFPGFLTPTAPSSHNCPMHRDVTTRPPVEAASAPHVRLWRTRRQRAALLVVACLTALVIAHGVHDSFHQDDAGAMVCIALTLGLASARVPQPLSLPSFEVVLALVTPRRLLLPTRVASCARGSPVSPIPLRL